MITFGYDCPHCFEKNIAFTVRRIANDLLNKKNTNQFKHYTIFATCNGCLGGILAPYVFNERSLSDISYPDKLSAYTEHNLCGLKQDIVVGLEWYPKKPEPDIPNYLSDDLTQKIRAAEKQYLLAKGDEDMLEFAGMAYRSTLEVAIAKLDDDTDKNLNWRINSLVKKGILVKPMGNFADRIRLLGNQATHDNIDLKSLEELRLFTQLFLQYAFTLPAMIPEKDKG